MSLQLLQIVADVRGVLVAVLAVRLEALRDDPLQLRRVIDAEPDRRHRTRARRHFVKHETERPDVCAVIDRLAPSLLRRHVCRRPDDPPRGSRGEGQRRCIVAWPAPASHLGQTEVQDLG